MSSLTSDFVEEGKKTNMEEFLADFYVIFLQIYKCSQLIWDLELLVCLLRWSPEWCKKVQYFLGLFQGFQSASCVTLCSASAAVPEESLMSDFVNPLYFPAVAGALKKHWSSLLVL